MPVAVAAKPKDLRDYYAALDAYAAQGVTHEGAVRSAFQHLLAGIPPDVFAYRLGNRSALECGSLTSIVSRPTNAAASAPTPTVLTTRNTSSASSAKSCASAWKR